MRAHRVAHRFLYARMFQAMSLQEAKTVLGFPPTANPTPEEINKAYKTKAFENHPDRGGDPAKMVEVNVAKDLLEGKGRATWRPEPSPPRPQRKPPEVVDTIGGASFQEAISKSGVPSNTEWKCISKPMYAGHREKGSWWNSDIWTLIGTTDSKVWVLSVKLRKDNSYFDPEKNGIVNILEDWQANLVSMSLATKNLAKALPSLVRSPSILFEDGTLADPPKKWVLWESGKLSEAGIRKVRMGSGGANLKDILPMVGLATADASRKSVVEIIPHYNLEKGRRIRKEQGGRLYTYQSFDYEVRVNGKSENLSDDTVKNLEKNGFIMSVFNYDPPDNRPKQLHKTRGSRFKGDAGVVIRLLADSLTSESSWLQIALEKAAEEWETE